MKISQRIKHGHKNFQKSKKIGQICKKLCLAQFFTAKSVQPYFLLYNSILVTSSSISKAQMETTIDLLVFAYMIFS